MAHVDLTRTPDATARRVDHFLPLRDPTRKTADGKENGEHVRRDAHRLVEKAAVEVDVRIQTSGDEILVLENLFLETFGNFQQRVGTSAPTLHRYENGWDKFEVSTLKRIAQALGVILEIRFIEPKQFKPSNPVSPKKLLKLIEKQ